MKVEELMIGNWVSAKKVKFPIRIEYINLIEDFPTTHTANDFDMDELSGIPLTEEWLLKFGAVRKYGNTFYIGKLKFDINTQICIRFHYSGKVVYLSFIHQLQNLIFALTGEELTPTSTTPQKART